MITYKEYSPTGWDIPGLNGDSLGRSNWLVAPCGRNRDSRVADESNFEVCLELLGGEQEDLVEVHRFGHWACGWFEIILVHPDLSNKVATIEKKLDNYPLLNEDDAIERELNAAQEYWASSSLSDRLGILKDYGKIGGEYGDSLFSIRHDWLPSSVEYQSLGF